MVAYAAPTQDLSFILNHLVGLDRLARLPGYEEATPDLVDAVLEEAARLAADVVAPLDVVGDHEHAVLRDGSVRMPTGFKEAYAEYRDGGWNALPFDPEHGGQGLPWVVAMAVQEMWQSASMAFGLCPMLNLGAVELIQAHGSEAQKAFWLPKMISGEWTGTMNLTESQAGSDLAAVRTRAVPDGNLYRITGQKIFITYGDHDLAENVVHMVLARTPDAPPGVKGISLFLVPKYLTHATGGIGELNDVRIVSLEDKLGIHASPTCVMAFGDNGGAIGELVGEENHGLQYMFTMMNNARLSVGLQGVAVAERAYQQARDYAQTRVQGRDLTAPGGSPVTIIHHPDVRRMLLDMKARTEAMRALIFHTAKELDTAKHHPDEDVRAAAQAQVDLLTPVAKAWCSDGGVEVASLGVQVHGGMGYVEESGAPQFYRDARIAPIYEGTNGVQAADLVFRKVARDNGTTARAFLGWIGDIQGELRARNDPTLSVIGARLGDASGALEAATDWVVATAPADPAAVAGTSARYLELFGIVAGGALMAQSALLANALHSSGDGDPRFLEGKVLTARYYADQVLPRAAGLLDPVRDGHEAIMAMAEDAF